MIQAFIYNMTVMITLTFLFLKFRDWLNPVVSKRHRYSYMVGLSLLIGVFTIAIMHDQFVINGILFDLRSTPMLIYASLAGPVWGLLAAIPVMGYRLLLGGDTAWLGVMVTVLLPVGIGGFLYPRTRIRKQHLKQLSPLLSEQKISYYPMIRVTNIVGLALMEHLLTYVIGVFTLELPAKEWIIISGFMALFGTLSLLFTVLMINEHTKSFIDREELYVLSAYDAKTGLPNLRYFESKVRESLSGRTGYIIMMDIDHFKVYNDTHGHIAGDLLLGKLGKLLQEEVSTPHLAGRFGGEEFIMMVDTDDLNEAEQVAEIVRTTIEETSFYGESHQPGGTLTVSLGVSKAGQELERLIKEADEALYRAKGQGRNQTALYDQEAATV
ncbi:diguanylate cyclase [Marinicrinis sediminis]|uniref:Diguanylate cyclase n=1 Tax=Marinicrinis sediminis TaxID=1652465 RepID=A0ABW5RFZ0_9BACL